MPEESKEVDTTNDADAVQEVLTAPTNVSATNEELEDEEDDQAEEQTTDEVAAGSVAKKKKSKKAKIKKALGVADKKDAPSAESGSNASPASKLTPEMVEQLLDMNPSLKSEVAGMNKEGAAERLKKLDVADLLTGMVRSPWPFCYG